MSAIAEIVKGTNDFTEQPIEKFLEDGVQKEKRIWHGPQALVDSFITGTVVPLSPQKIRWTEGVPAIVEATFDGTATGGGDQVQDVEDAGIWELIGEDLEKPLNTHGYFNISGASEEMLERCDDAIRKGIASDTAWDTLYPGFNLQSYVDHRIRGVDTWISFSYIVRKTVTFNSSVPLKVEFTTNAQNPNIPGKVITWGQIGIPTSAKFAQPKLHYWPHYSTGDNKWGDFLVNEWLVKAPSLRWEKGKRLWTFTREWWGAEQWAGKLYDGGSWLPA